MYDFQNKIQRTGDMLDNREISRDLTRAAEAASSLDNEELTDAMLAGASVASGAYHTFNINVVEQNPGFSAAGANPTISGGNVVKIETTASWQDIKSVTITTDEEILRICAWVQYVYDLTTSTPSVSSTPPASVQFGIRVDGQLVYYTGNANPAFVEFLPLRAETQRGAYDMTPGPTTVKDKFHCSGLGPPILPVDIQVYHEVSPSTHTVALCARVLTQQPSTAGVGASDFYYVYIYDRSLVVQRIPVDPAATSTADGASIAEIPTETTLSTVELKTNRSDVILAKLNAVTPGMIRRRAANNRVLPAVLLDGTTTTIFNNGTYTNISTYPGYVAGGVALTIDATADGTGTGWWLVKGTGPVNLRSDVTHAAALLTSLQTGIIEVFASISIREISEATADTWPWPFMAAFVLGYKLSSGSTIYKIGGTSAFVGHPGNRINALSPPAQMNAKTRISVRGWLDYSSSPPASNIDHVGLYICTLATAGLSLHPTAVWRHANLNVKVWRP